ncbi:MAG: peptidylprolyl isomerase [Clostridia bacterium]|nr:peptidylprolyl isomerase [Clostridia bacterium]
MFKNLKRFVSMVLAITGVCACTATLTACETPHPEVRLTLSFNDETYTLDYVLYRNITPATVNHFLALAENKYYDGLCVHDYTTGALYTGAYSYESEKLVYKNYFDTVASYIPQTVWSDSEKTKPTYTLYGEFESNNFSVENGDLSESFGALVMYYSDKKTEGEVYVQRNQDGKLAPRSYEENSATSQFFISLNESASSNNDYCVFATLKEGSVSVLKSLQTAIADYVSNTYGEDEADEFVTETEMEIDVDDEMLGGNGSTVFYDVPNEPIVITSVKVKKY